MSGWAGSMIGMGGALVAMPFLSSFFKMSQHRVNGTTMAVALCTSMGSCVAFFRSERKDDKAAASEQQADATSDSTPLTTTAEPEDTTNLLKRLLHFDAGSIDVPTALGVGLAGSLFAILGARISKRASARLLTGLQGAFILALAPTALVREELQTWKEGLQAPSFQNPSTDLDQHPLNLLVRPVAVGVASGFTAGLFGVGGGAITVPALCLLTDLPYKTILGTSLAAMLPTALSGCVSHFLQKTMVVPIAVPLGIGCLIGSNIGGTLVASIDEKFLQYFFSFFMLAIGFRTLLRARR